MLTIPIYRKRSIGSFQTWLKIQRLPYIIILYDGGKMEPELIYLLDCSLKCIDCRVKEHKIIIETSSGKQQATCPYRGCNSSKIHSIYQREIQDIPLHDKQTMLLLNIRKMFCDNPECSHKTFSERFDFVSPKGKKTKRLIENY